MRKATTGFCTLAFAGAALVSGSALSGQAQRPSPPAKAECKFTDGKTVTVNYSSPRMNKRKIYGELVPYGQEWRAGANEATTFVTTAAVTAGGKAVPAGSYTLYALPTASDWTLVISKKTGQWGVPYPGAADDFVRAPMSVSKLPSAVENFTISFTQAASSCTMHVDWETTRASIEVKK